MGTAANRSTAFDSLQPETTLEKKSPWLFVESYSQPRAPKHAFRPFSIRLDRWAWPAYTRPMSIDVFANFDFFSSDIRRQWLTGYVVYAGVLVLLLLSRLIRSVLDAGRLPWTARRNHDHITVAQTIALRGPRPVIRYRQWVGVQSENQNVVSYSLGFRTAERTRPKRTQTPVVGYPEPSRKTGHKLGRKTILSGFSVPNRLASSNRWPRG